MADAQARARFGRYVMTACVWVNAANATGLALMRKFELALAAVAFGAAAVAMLNYYLRKECE
jgi:hypothetical protein